MCGRGPVRLTIGVLLAALAWMASCTYSPNPESGSLFCGANSSCPKGYNCADGRTCWKDGVKPTDDAGMPIDVQKDIVTRPDVPGRVLNFVGSWDFVSGTVSTTCSDNSTDSRPLAGDFMDIGPGTDSDLIASFYCDWKVNVSGTTTMLARPGQTCMTTSMGAVFTWTVVNFNFSTSDGQSGMLNSRINAAYNNAGDVGTCMLTISGGLVRSP